VIACERCGASNDDGATRCACGTALPSRARATARPSWYALRVAAKATLLTPILVLLYYLGFGLFASGPGEIASALSNDLGRLVIESYFVLAPLALTVVLIRSSRWLPPGPNVDRLASIISLVLATGIVWSVMSLLAYIGRCARGY